MKQRPRINYSENRKPMKWVRWRKGDTLQQLAQLFDRNHSWIQGILAQVADDSLRSIAGEVASLVRTVF